MYNRLKDAALGHLLCWKRRVMQSSLSGKIIANEDDDVEESSAFTDPLLVKGRLGKTYGTSNR